VRRKLTIPCAIIHRTITSNPVTVHIAKFQVHAFTPQMTCYVWMDGTAGTGDDLWTIEAGLTSTSPTTSSATFTGGVVGRVIITGDGLASGSGLKTDKGTDELYLILTRTSGSGAADLLSVTLVAEPMSGSITT
jgi:hypothetical protein